MIVERIKELEDEGMSLSLTPDGKIRLDGPRSKIKEAAVWIRQHRAAVVDYLAARGPEAAPSTEEGEDSEIIADNAPQFTHCPHCGQPLFAPAPEIQVEHFRKFQLEHSSYYHWTS